MDKELFYNKVFDLLASIGGAPESMRSNFVHHHTKEEPPKEYRFQGHLGFGGKYWSEDNVVSYYAEDYTIAIDDLNHKLNLALASLKSPSFIPWKTDGRYIWLASDPELIKSRGEDFSFESAPWQEIPNTAKKALANLVVKAVNEYALNHPKDSDVIATAETQEFLELKL
jgi:hypothetical protein